MSEDNVVQFPPLEKRPDLLVGPFEEWRVQVEGRIIPRLTGYHDGDKIALVVDHRFSSSFEPDAAYSAAWLIAQAMAIAEGYPFLGAETKQQPFAPMGISIGPELDHGKKDD
jgi:hypothetical protein